MSLREDAAPYFVGTWPFMKRIPEDTDFDGNGVLYTSIYFITLRVLGEWDEEIDKPHIDAFYAKCMVHRGLIDRGHDNLSMEAQDDYIGLAAAGYYCAPYIAEDIRLYGHNNFWFYKNMEEAKLPFFAYLSCWFMRLPGVTEHFKMSACYSLNWVERLWWKLSIFWGTRGKAEEVSGRQLEWLMAMVGQHNSALEKTCDLFSKNIAKKYPDGYMGEVFAKFYQRTDHVFAKYWWRKILDGMFIHTL